MKRLFKKRIKKAYRVGKIINVLPFVRAVILNGSLAKGKTKINSDIDLLIISKTGRIFSARFFVNIFLTIFLLKRSSKDENKCAGLFCVNYFMTENYLKIPTGRGEKTDKYCADNYSTSLLVAGDMKLYEKYMETNKRLYDLYGYNYHLRSLGPTSKNSPRFLKTATEKIFGETFERWVKQYQIRRIEKDPITKKFPTLIVYNDNELRFHPPKSKHKNY